MLGLRLSPTVLNTFKNRNFASGKKADSFSWSAELRESAKIAEASSAGFTIEEPLMSAHWANWIKPKSSKRPVEMKNNLPISFSGLNLSNLNSPIKRNNIDEFSKPLFLQSLVIDHNCFLARKLKNKIKRSFCQLITTLENYK